MRSKQMSVTIVAKILGLVLSTFITTQEDLAGTHTERTYHG